MNIGHKLGLGFLLVALLGGANAALGYLNLMQSSAFALVAAVITVSVAVFVWILVSRSISKPVTMLEGAVTEIGKGNLDVKIEEKHGGEIGRLASALMQMVKNLNESQKKASNYMQELEEKIRVRAGEVEKKVQELTSTKTAVLNMMEDMEETNRELIGTQEELEKSLKELKEMDVKKDQFISIAAHELKTPLTSIHGFSQLLQNRKVANNFTKRSKYLKIMDHETKRLSKLVSDILDLSRIDLGTVKFSLEKVNLKELMDTVRREMNVQIKEKGLDSEYIIDRELPGIVTDREKLTETLLNLINNAVKYTPKGKITVSALKEGDGIHFIVKDTGIGIAKENHKKIFDRFYQVDSSYSRKAGGTGLGLALCSEFIGFLGGRIWVKSELGKGSEFHFTLPLKCDLKDRESRAGVQRVAEKAPGEETREAVKKAPEDKGVKEEFPNVENDWRAHQDGISDNKAGK